MSNLKSFAWKTYGLSFLFLGVACMIVAAASIIKSRRPKEASFPKPIRQFNVEGSMVSMSMAQAIKEICFERYDLQESTKVHQPWIYLKDLSTGKERRLIRGSQPDLSPSGKNLAFNGGNAGDVRSSFANPGGRQDDVRIQMLNLDSGTVRDFDSLVSLRTYHPLWSGDGKKIAFLLINANATRADIGVVDPLTGQWQNVSKNFDFGKPSESVYLDSWGGSDQSIVLHTFEDIYELAIDGRLLRKISTKGLGISTSETRILLSSDGRRLVFNRTDETANGPIETMYLFDLESNKLSRITPEAVSASSPRWLSSEGEILFSCADSSTRPNSSDVCQISIDGTGIKKLAQNGDYPSSAK